jgi:hypothetical protein
MAAFPDCEISDFPAEGSGEDVSNEGSPGSSLGGMAEENSIGIGDRRGRVSKSFPLD